MNKKLLRRAYKLIEKLSDEKVEFFARLFGNGDECVQAFSDSGITKLSEANKFLDEWEAQHDR